MSATSRSGVDSIISCPSASSRRVCSCRLGDLLACRLAPVRRENTANVFGVADPKLGIELRQHLVHEPQVAPPRGRPPVLKGQAAGRCSVGRRATAFPRVRASGLPTPRCSQRSRGPRSAKSGGSPALWRQAVVVPLRRLMLRRNSKNPPSREFSAPDEPGMIAVLLRKTAEQELRQVMVALSQHRTGVERSGRRRRTRARASTATSRHVSL